MTRVSEEQASQPDEENPEWTAEDMRTARPAREVLPQYIGEEATLALMRGSRGRPPKPDKKVNQTLRLDADVVEAYRSQGYGWQTRMNQVLREHMPGRLK